MEANSMEKMIARLQQANDAKKKRLLATIKHQAMLEIRSALKQPVYC